uniref:SPX domain-containing protein n=1 Tax=Amphimedon queenslandica TaxID=400682 RepID=A0A1X7T5Z1_AMPQE
KLNHTGFRKILKKHDKLASSDRGSKFFKENVEKSYFHKSKEINALVQRTEDIMINQLENGNRGRAMAKLRVPPLGGVSSPWAILASGWLMGAIFIMAVVAIIAYEKHVGEPCLYTAAKGNHVDIVKYLIKECRCSPMTRSPLYGSVPFLHYVASKGLLDILKCIVMNINGHIMDKHCCDTNGRTVLHCAVKHIDVVKYLINECNCDIMVTDKDGVSFLHYVARKGLLDVLKCMVMNINGHIMDEQYRDTNGRTVLHCAVKHINVVKYLINECNCDIMVTDKDGAPFLHYVASERLLDVLKCMVMNINGHIMDEQYRDTNGRTILHCAVKHIDVVKYLINECSCDIMTPDKDGNTILHDVANKKLLTVFKYLINTHHYPMTTKNSGQIGAVKHVDVVKYLIKECNCDIMTTDKDGIPFLHYVAREGLLDVLKCMVMNINGHIMDEQYRDTNGRTVLHCAVKHIDVVKYLINECNCDIMVTDKDGVSFLHYVARKGLLDVLKCMVMNINGHIMDEQYRDTNGRTVLHCAVKHINVVKYLINECNCDIMVTDKDGAPFLHYVASERLLDVLKCMVMNINGHIMDEQYRDTNGRT